MDNHARIAVNPGSIGLLIFFIVVSLDAAGLALDSFLAEHGAATISSYARQYPTIGIAAVLLQLVAAVGIGLHFWSK